MAAIPLPLHDEHLPTFSRLALTTTHGEQFHLVSAWRDRPALLFFLRHLGCAVCRAELARLCAQQDALRAAGANVVVIAPVDALAAQRFAQIQRLPFQLLADPLRVSYRAFGFEEGSLWDALGPHVLVRQAAEALRGNISSVSPSLGPIRQLGGVCVVDTRGVVRFRHVALPIYHYLPMAEYLRAIEDSVKPTAG